MNRKLAFVLVAVAAVALVTGTGGYSSVNAERGVSVDVVGDGDAYLTLEYSETAELSGTDAYEVTFLTIRNRFTVDADLDATALPSSTSDGLDVTYTSGSRSVDTRLAPGEAVDFAAELTCASAGEQNVTFTIDAKADGPGVSVNTTEERTASFDVRCRSVAIRVEETEGTVGGGSFTLLHLDDTSNQSASVDSVSVPDDANVSLASSTGDGAEGYGDVEAECVESTNGTSVPVRVTVEGSGETVDFTRHRTVDVLCEPGSTATATATATTSTSGGS